MTRRSIMPTMTGSRPTETRLVRRDVLIALALVVAVLAVYWPVRHFGFVRFDDPTYLFENPAAMHGLTVASAQGAFTSVTLASYMPVAMLTSFADVSVWGMNPGPMHLENAFIHALSAAGWYLVWFRLTGKRGRSAMVAGLFGLHPMHVEPVAWIVERGDVLCMLCMVASLLAFLEFVRRCRWAFYVASLFFFMVALFSKPVAVVLPAVILLVGVWPLQRIRWGFWSNRRQGDALADRTISFGRATSELLPFCALAVAASVAVILSRSASHASPSLHQWSVWDRLATVITGYAEYLLKAVWPEPMLPFYPMTLVLRGGPLFAATLALATIAIGAVRVGRKRPYIVVGGLWWVVTLLPSVGIIQTGSQSIADRYTYLPYVGLSVAAVWWIAEIIGPMAGRSSWRATVVATSLGAGVLGACAVGSRRQLSHWQNSYEFFSHAYAFEPDDPIISRGAGTEYRLADQPELAIDAYSRSVRADPSDGATQTNLAGQLMSVDPRLALPHFEIAARELAHSPQAWWNLGNCQLRLGQSQSAIESFEKALQLSPDFEPARASMKSISAWE